MPTCKQMELIDLLLLGGIAYYVYSTNPKFKALADTAGTVLKTAETNVSSASKFFQGDFAGSYDDSCQAPLAFLRPDCAIYNAQKGSYNVGAGTPATLQGCPSGFTDGGLLCTNWSSLQTVTKQMRCPDDREMVDGLCYSRCPASHPSRVAGMPYLCKR